MPVIVRDCSMAGNGVTEDAAWIQTNTHDHAGCQPLLINKRLDTSNNSSS